MLSAGWVGGGRGLIKGFSLCPLPRMVAPNINVSFPEYNTTRSGLYLRRAWRKVVHVGPHGHHSAEQIVARSTMDEGEEGKWETARPVVSFYGGSPRWVYMQAARD